VRIALLPSAYAPAVGGVEILTARLASHLQSRGHAVEVWTSRSHGDALPLREDIDGVHVRRFVFTLPRADARALLRFPAAGLTNLSALRAASREFRPEVLHVQCFSGNGAYATALSHLTRVPLAITLQGETVMDDHDIYDRSATLRTALRLGLRRAAAVTGCSAFTLHDARDRFGLDMNKARVVFNGVDLDEPSETRVRPPFPRYVLGVGRVVPKKGFDLLVDAFSRLQHLDPAVGLVVGGAGPELERLRRDVVARGLEERVFLPGRLTRGEVVALMQHATVFAMPSRVEPFGIVALEAWRAGVPVVVTSHGGTPEFVEDGVSGLVADPRDPERLATALQSLLVSPELRERVVEGARQRLPRFEWSSLVDEYEIAYRGLTMQDHDHPGGDM
jgi:glycogen(starch) synthase